ncbi:hypothetical protein Drorol1_Dr00012364 [Drosera rotundifolia]
MLQPSLLYSPSLNHHSHSADIAARVLNELHLNNNHLDDEDYLFDDVVLVEAEQRRSNKGKEMVPQIEEENNDDDVDEGNNDVVDEEVEAPEEEESEFEFAVVTRDDDTESAISADEIFENGQIRPIFPLFNTDLIPGGTNWINNRSNRIQSNQHDLDSVIVADRIPSIRRRHPLSKLLTEEKAAAAMAASCSSSEADELDNVPPGTYCVWKPNEAMMMRKKSNSTGSSKRWRLRELLRRSISDGKETFVFLAPRCESGKSKAAAVEKAEKSLTATEPKKKKKAATAMVAQEEHYLKGRAMRESDRRRSYLPYRRDLVGLFSNVNGLSRAVRPF